MRAGRSGPGLYIELAPAPAEPSCGGSGGEEVLGTRACGSQASRVWREPWERESGGGVETRRWTGMKGFPRSVPVRILVRRPRRGRGWSVSPRGRPRASFPGSFSVHRHFGKVSRAGGLGCGSLSGETLKHSFSFTPPHPPPPLFWNRGPITPASDTARRVGLGRRERSLEDVTPEGSLHPLLPRHSRSPNWRGTGSSSARQSRASLPPGAVPGSAWMAQRPSTRALCTFLTALPVPGCSSGRESMRARCRGTSVCQEIVQYCFQATFGNASW